MRTKKTVYEAKLPKGATALNVPLPLVGEWSLAGWDIALCEIEDCGSSFHNTQLSRHWVPYPMVILYGRGDFKLFEEDHGFEIEEHWYNVS